MSEENKSVETEVDVVYGYKDDKGKFLWTPNQTLAYLRAQHFGTYDVYEEKN